MTDLPYFANLRKHTMARAELEVKFQMATALDMKTAQDLLTKQTRVRGGYVATWNRLLASDDPAWDVTDDHTGVKLQSALIGYKSAVEKNEHLKDKVRPVLTDGKLYLIKL